MTTPSMTSHERDVIEVLDDLRAVVYSMEATGQSILEKGAPIPNEKGLDAFRVLGAYADTLIEEAASIYETGGIS